MVDQQITMALLLPPLQLKFTFGQLKVPMASCLFVENKEINPRVPLIILYSWHVFGPNMFRRFNGFIFKVVPI